MKRYLSFLVYLLVFTLLMTSCRKNIELEELAPNADLYVSATSLGVYPKATLQAFAVSAGLSTYTSLVKYDVEFYKFVYNTTFKGKKVQASGLLAVPKSVLGIPSLLSAQHGTMFKATEAPSNFPATFTGFELFAAGGFITIIPDFIGYGVSQNIPHPYYDQHYSGLAVIDMIKAAKYYLNKQNIPVSDRLFLIGYSEGGYVTMAAQKEIETNPANKLAVTAAAEGAGGYDLNGMLSAVASVSTYSAPSYLALLLNSYNKTYDWNRPFTDFYQQPYADRIPGLLNGTKNRSEVDASLNKSLTALFNPTFYNALQNPSAEMVLKQKLAANSFLDWVPKSPTRMYHGTADEAVFYQTSVDTYNRFKAAGATNVEFFSIANGTHEKSVQPMIENALPWIQSLDK